MDPNLPTASILVVKNGMITCVTDKLFLHGGYHPKKTKIVNLKQKTMTPGFIDAHSHFSFATVYDNLGFSITPPPFGTVNSIAEMIQNAKDYLARTHLAAGLPIYSVGYSDYKMIDHRHPTRF